MIIFGFSCFVAGILLIGRNYRGRARVGVLRMKPSSSEFSALVVAIALTAATFIALATIPLYARSSATVTYTAGDSSSHTVTMDYPPPNLSPPGVPQSLGDLFQLTTILFVLIPAAVIALPLLFKRSSYRGVVEAAIATLVAAFSVVAGFSVGLFFLPTTTAMLIAAAFAREKVT